MRGVPPPGPRGIAEMRSSISAVGEYVTRIVGQGIGTGASIMDIGRCHRNFLDQRRAGVGADMRLEAVHRGSPLVLYPVPFIIRLSG